MRGGKIKLKQGGAFGFTVLEVVISLTLIVMLSGAVILGSRSLDKGKDLRDAITEIEVLTARSRSSALHQQKTFWLVFSGKEIRVVQATMNQRAEDLAKMPAVELYKLPDGVEVQVAGWRSKGFQQATNRNPIALVFSPLGVNEPVSIKVKSDQGFIEQDYHPLSGVVEEERFEIL